MVPLSSSFRSELFRWMNYRKCQAASDYESISVSTLLAKPADNIFFPNIRELKILAVLPVGSTEVERSFSSIRRIYTWLRNTMTTEQLSDLAIWMAKSDRFRFRFFFNPLGWPGGHPRGLTPGNLRAFAPRHLQIPIPRANILPQKATTVLPPGSIIWKDS